MVNRTAERAARLAAPVGGGSAGLDALGEQFAAADVVVTCTGATGVVIGAEHGRRGAGGTAGGTPLAVVDLALPHDVDPVLAADPRIHYTGLAALADDLANGPARPRSARPRDSGRGGRRLRRCSPRRHGNAHRRGPAVDGHRRRRLRAGPAVGPVPRGRPAVRAEVGQTVRRVAGKLLHAPTTRVKELTGQPAGMSYAEVLAELFSLPSGTAEAVTRAAVEPNREQPGEFP